MATGTSVDEQNRMARTVSKSSRIEARITPDQKSLIERAAAYEGRTVSDFVVQTVQRAARTIVEEHEVIQLNREQSAALVELLLNPPAPNRALKKAAKEYRKRVVSR
jgi:uncharacterized protein (DUF1778 family)